MVRLTEFPGWRRATDIPGAEVKNDIEALRGSSANDGLVPILCDWIFKLSPRSLFSFLGVSFIFIAVLFHCLWFS